MDFYICMSGERIHLVKLEEVRINAILTMLVLESNQKTELVTNIELHK